MVRTASITLVALVTLSCGGQEEDKTELSAATDTPSASAQLTYRSETWNLHVTENCGPAADGSYNTLAVTLDAEGNTVVDGPQLLALHESDWSIIDFLPGTGQQIVRAYREGDEVFIFNDGVLEFDGELGAGQNENMHVRLTCPD